MALQRRTDPGRAVRGTMDSPPLRANLRAAARLAALRLSPGFAKHAVPLARARCPARSVFTTQRVQELHQHERTHDAFRCRTQGGGGGGGSRRRTPGPPRSHRAARRASAGADGATARAASRQPGVPRSGRPGDEKSKRVCRRFTGDRSRSLRSSKRGAIPFG